MMELTPTITVPEVAFFIVGVVGLLVSLSNVSDAASVRYVERLAKPRTPVEEAIHRGRMDQAETSWRASVLFFVVLLLLTLIAALTMLRQNIDADTPVTYAIAVLRITAQCVTIGAIHLLKQQRRRTLRDEHESLRVARTARTYEAHDDATD